VDSQLMPPSKPIVFIVLIPLLRDAQNTNIPRYSFKY
jgi:hypothetical protein